MIGLTFTLQDKVYNMGSNTTAEADSCHSMSSGLPPGTSNAMLFPLSRI